MRDNTQLMGDLALFSPQLTGVPLLDRLNACRKRSPGCRGLRQWSFSLQQTTASLVVDRRPTSAPLAFPPIHFSVCSPSRSPSASSAHAEATPHRSPERRLRVCGTDTDWRDDLGIAGRNTHAHQLSVSASASDVPMYLTGLEALHQLVDMTTIGNRWQLSDACSRTVTAGCLRTLPAQNKPRPRSESVPGKSTGIDAVLRRCSGTDAASLAAKRKCADTSSASRSAKISFTMDW